MKYTWSILVKNKPYEKIILKFSLIINLGHLTIQIKKYKAISLNFTFVKTIQDSKRKYERNVKADITLIDKEKKIR